MCPSGTSRPSVSRPADRLPKMMGFQAEGAAPIVLGHPVENPQTIATAIKIGNPASWKGALKARDESDGVIGMVTDHQQAIQRQSLPRQPCHVSASDSDPVVWSGQLSDLTTVPKPEACGRQPRSATEVGWPRRLSVNRCRSPVSFTCFPTRNHCAYGWQRDGQQKYGALPVTTS